MRILTNLWTDAEGGVCVSVEVKGLQDAVDFAMGAIGEHVGVGASHTHFPSHQPQCPGQSSMAQRCKFDTITTGRHDDGGKQRDRHDHEPHFKRCEEDGKNCDERKRN